MTRKPTKADPFAVWGKPPAPLDKLPPKHLGALRRYVEGVTGKAYRVAYDNGLVEGLTKISLMVSVEVKKQRDRTFKGR